MSDQRSQQSGTRSSRWPAGRLGKRENKQSLRERLRSPRFWALIAALAIANWVLVMLLFPSSSDRITIPYTDFRAQVEAGNVSRITTHKDDIQGDLRRAIVDPDAAEGDADTTTYTEFQTTLPSFVDSSSLESFLIDNGVTIDAEPLEQPRSLMATLLLGFGPTILLIGGFLWFSGKVLGGAGGGILRLGRSRATRYDPTTQTPITFADVAGIDEVQAELVEVVDFLKNPAKYQRLGGTIPHGVLLIGPPGTGKTLLARAVAGEAHVPFFSMSGSEFIEMVVGVGASRVRDLFKQAREAAPAIIFIDELDAIGGKRGSTPAAGGSQEREQTLNQILVEMDGFAVRESLIVIAATNRADVLDPALLRPGRFDRRVTVLPPDKHGRAAILGVHTRGVPLADDVDLDIVASESPGLVGAEIRNLVNEAALTAARRGRDSVSQRDFSDALEKIALGAERRLAMSAEDRERVAYHEAGHALIGLLQPESDPVRRVTVIPRGQALGVTLSVPEADRYNYSEDYIRARLVSTLGGRAAEQIVYGTVTTGAENDIKQVTEMARAMVTRWGMSGEVGLLAIDTRESGDFLNTGLNTGANPFSEETARLVDAATRRIIDEAYTTALDLLTLNRPRLESLTEALLREESLNLDQMLEATGLSHERFAAAAPLAVALGDD